MTSQLLLVIENNGDNLLKEVNQLLKEGEDPNVGDAGKSPLLIASTNCRFDVVKLLLSKGADESQLAWTPLFKCVFFDTTSDLEALLTNLTETTDQLGLEHYDHDKRTPLALAILLGETAKADLLIEAGAQTEALFSAPVHLKIAMLDEPEKLNHILNLTSEPYNKVDAMRVAIAKECYKCIKFLLDTESDLHDESIFWYNFEPEENCSVNMLRFLYAMKTPESIQTLLFFTLFFPILRLIDLHSMIQYVRQYRH